MGCKSVTAETFRTSTAPPIRSESRSRPVHVRAGKGKRIHTHKMPRAEPGTQSTKWRCAGRQRAGGAEGGVPPGRAQEQVNQGPILPCHTGLCGLPQVPSPPRTSDSSSVKQGVMKNFLPPETDLRRRTPETSRRSAWKRPDRNHGDNDRRRLWAGFLRLGATQVRS